MDSASQPSRYRGALVAVLVALLLSATWAARDWANLSALRLPDTDDAARLQQIRDWLGGQGFADLAQHRLGLPSGLQMHWSRLPDLIPAGIIAVLTPLMGAQAAQVATVIALPFLLFAATLVTIASIARTLGQSGALAAIVAALAYPASTIFLPGRIDHHGLQLLLLLLVVRAVIGAGSRRWGAVAGLASAASIAIGLETAPLLALGTAIIVGRWIAGDRGADARLAGFGISLFLALAFAGAVLRTTGWDYPACDGFTAQLWRGAQVAALAPLLLAILAFRLSAISARATVAALVSGMALLAALLIAPACLSPYGAVDPMLSRQWLAHVAEAQSLFTAPLANIIAYLGLATMGVVAGVIVARRTRGIDWLVVLAFQIAALAIALVQLRGAYAGAILAAPALTALIALARAKGALPLAAAWIVSAGLIYPLIGRAAAPASHLPAQSENCTGPQALARLAALPPGLLMAPVDLGAFALAGTPHRLAAAPYHRNTEGNRTMYDFFLGPADGSASLARHWGIDYVALCPDSFDELGAAKTDQGLAADLRAGRIPAWLTPVSAPGQSPLVFSLSQRGAR